MRCAVERQTGTTGCGVRGHHDGGHGAAQLVGAVHTCVKYAAVGSDGAAPAGCGAEKGAGGVTAAMAISNAPPRPLQPQQTRWTESSGDVTRNRAGVIYRVLHRASVQRAHSLRPFGGAERLGAKVACGSCQARADARTRARRGCRGADGGGWGLTPQPHRRCPRPRWAVLLQAVKRGACAACIR